MTMVVTFYGHLGTIHVLGSIEDDKTFFKCFKLQIQLAEHMSLATSMFTP
jgi:hypothetical protein